jgi:hypothetical protein
MTNSLCRQGLLVSLLFVSSLAFADDHEELERPSFFVSQSATVNAVVKSVNLETREVVLNRADGEIISFIASDEVRNLAQVEPGDVVTANYEESLSIEVLANEGFEPEEVELAAMARAEEGQKPGMAAIDTVVETATVEDINIEANTFKLRTADGAVREYAARNPDNLKRAKVGDLVVFTVVSALAISVTEQPSE